MIAELTAYLTPLSPPESQHGYSIDKLPARDVDFFVLRIDGKPAGCGGIEFLGMEYGELKPMYVRPEFRRQGLGKRILGHICVYAGGRGVPMVRLETGSFMDDTIKLYESSGFYRISFFGNYKADSNSSFFEKHFTESFPTVSF